MKSLSESSVPVGKLTDEEAYKKFLQSFLVGVCPHCGEVLGACDCFDAEELWKGED